MKYLFIICLFLLAKSKTAEDYYNCLDTYATPKARLVISNIKNHKISENLPIIYEISRNQAQCAFTDPLPSLNEVRDYIYKDVYQHIFKLDEKLLSLHEFFWNVKNEKETIEKCHNLFDDKIDCKELYDSFMDWIHKKLIDE